VNKKDWVTSVPKRKKRKKVYWVPLVEEVHRDVDISPHWLLCIPFNITFCSTQHIYDVFV